MTFYHDNKLTMMGLDSNHLDFLYAPSTSKRTYSNMSQGEMMSPSWIDFHNVGLAPSASDESYPVGKYLGVDPGNEDTRFDGITYGATNSVLDSAMAAATAQDDPEDTLPGSSANTGATYGLTATEGTNATIKLEEDENAVSLTPYGGSEYDESDYDDPRPSKVPKLNKDGVPRKPRQPRPKLLKWDDNDWKNVALGLVWACGENGIQIPFDQASQVVSESCTAGALQQALLKLRGKQISEGFQIPSLKMAWTRKNKNGTFATSSANPKPQQGMEKNLLPKKRPTRFLGTQSLVISLKRSYNDADRAHLVFPHSLANAQRADDATQQAPTTPPVFSMPTLQQGLLKANGAFSFSQQAPSMLPISPMAIQQGMLQAAGVFGSNQSLDFPMFAAAPATGAFHYDPLQQISPSNGVFDRPFGTSMSPPRLRTIYEEDEGENGLPLSPIPNAFGAGRGHRRGGTKVLTKKSLSKASTPAKSRQQVKVDTKPSFHDITSMMELNNSTPSKSGTQVKVDTTPSFNDITSMMELNNSRDRGRGGSGGGGNGSPGTAYTPVSDVQSGNPGY